MIGVTLRLFLAAAVFELATVPAVFVKQFGVSAVLAVSANALPKRSEYDVERKWFVTMDEDNNIHYVDLTMAFPYVVVNDSEVTFYYHSRKTAETKLDLNTIEELRKTDFTSKRDTLFIIHGWNNDKDSVLNEIIVPATLDTRDWNVFVVDWSPIASKLYGTAKGSVPQIGEIVAKFIRYLAQKFQLSLPRVHLAGHSLGAHVAGRVGSIFVGQISSIVGMDPAMPLFSYDDINERLDPTDATYVHIIHTCGGFLGFQSPLGHADYYPNGGRSQNGCGWDVLGICAHGRSYRYFAESIERGKFIGEACDSYDDYVNGLCDNHEKRAMGGYILDRNASGPYYLDTAPSEPFGLG